MVLDIKEKKEKEVVGLTQLNSILLLRWNDETWSLAATKMLKLCLT